MHAASDAREPTADTTPDDNPASGRRSEHTDTTSDAREPTADTTPDDNPAIELTERDRRVLAFERQWWKYAGAKEQAIREQFDMSATRYYQLLNALIDRTEALAYDPLLVKRLRRMRSARQRQRAARRLGARG